VAGRVAAYLAGVQERLRRAELERAAAEVRAVEERKRRRLAVALAAAVVFGGIVTGGGAWWFQHQRALREAETARRRQEADRAVRAAMDEGRLLLVQAREQPLGDEAKLREAQAAARKAAELAESREASEDLRREAETLRAESNSEAVAITKDRRLLARLAEAGPVGGGEDHILRGLANPDSAYERAFHEYGLDLGKSPEKSVVERLKARPALVREEITAALEEWAVVRSINRYGSAARLWALASAVDPKPDGQRDQLRAIARRNRLLSEAQVGVVSHALMPLAALADLVPGEDRNQLRQIARALDPQRTPTLTLRLVSTLLDQAGDNELACGLLRTARQSRPGDVYLALGLGYLLDTPGYGFVPYRRHRPDEAKRKAEALACFEAARAVRPELAIGSARELMDIGRKEEAAALLRDLLTKNPDDERAWFWLSMWDEAQGRLTEAKDAFRNAARLIGPTLGDRKAFLLHIWACGQARDSQVDPRDQTPPDKLPRTVKAAIHRRALELLPDYAIGYGCVGDDLVAQEKYVEAEAVYRKGIQAEPENPVGYRNLGKFLLDRSRFKEAEALIRGAISERPATFQANATSTNRVIRLDTANTYNILSLALQRQGKLEEAIELDRRAVATVPWEASQYLNLGNTLRAGGRISKAIAAYRQCLRINKDFAEAHVNLAIAFDDQVRLWPGDPRNQARIEDAVAECRRAIELKPDLAPAHTCLGLQLGRQGKLEESVAAFREAIRLAPRVSHHYHNLGLGLQQLGRLTEALAAYQKALGLDAGNQAAQSQFRNLRPIVALLPRLEAVRQGKVKPESARDCLQLGTVAVMRHYWKTAVRLYEKGFAADPVSEHNLGGGHRYNAACAAARLGCVPSEEGPPPGAVERARRRRQALAWLRADLDAWARQLEGGKLKERRVMRANLRHWLEDPDLAGLRDPKQVKSLPADERSACRQVWDKVGGLLEKARCEIAGALEGETLKLLGMSGDFEATPHNMTMFDDGDWSGDTQLWVRPWREGAWVDLELPVPAQGKYQLVVYLTKSWDYGIVQFALDGKPVGKPIDCFNVPNVVSTGPIDLGKVELKKSTATLRGRVVGTNVKSVGTHYSWGLDCVVLKPAGP
jgi:tetratricopeptide (TPR) repeat protein